MCARLDGIPLALELAAAQTTLMTPAEIDTRLNRQFRVLTGGPNSLLERHQTLRAAIDWSYNLLNDDERTLLERLSVCNGGFDLDAVAAIAARTSADEYDAIDLLRSLVAKSLVERNERNGTTRYRMLEMIRQYAAEQLDASNLADAAEMITPAITWQWPSRYSRTCGPSVITTRSTNSSSKLPMSPPPFVGCLPTTDSTSCCRSTVTCPSSMPSPLPHLRSMISLPSPTTSSARTDVPPGRALATACWFSYVHWFVHGDMERTRQLSQFAQRFADEDFAAVRFAIDSVLVMLDGHLDQAATFAAEAVERARRGDDTGETVWTLAQYAAIASNTPDTDALTRPKKRWRSRARQEAASLVSTLSPHS